MHLGLVDSIETTVDFSIELSATPYIKAIYGNCFDVLKNFEDESIQAVVTDPPYGVKEYEPEELEKKNTGSGGIWRLPPAFDGHQRAPMPRFTALNAKERNELKIFFYDFGEILINKMVPGSHMFIACNSFLSQIVYASLIESGFEFRTEIIRLVQTLRGGDRPKNAEKEFPDVCSLPRGSYEPWGLFRKPIPEKMTVAECLRNYKTGGLRRKKNGTPFSDVIISERTPKSERDIINHPSLKPQSLMRQIVYSALPLGIGTIVDPFMGSGSTLAAAKNVRYNSIGIERDQSFYHLAISSIEDLSTLKIRDNILENELDFN